MGTTKPVAEAGQEQVSATSRLGMPRPSPDLHASRQRRRPVRQRKIRPLHLLHLLASPTTGPRSSSAADVNSARKPLGQDEEEEGDGPPIPQPQAFRAIEPNLDIFQHYQQRYTTTTTTPKPSLNTKPDGRRLLDEWRRPDSGNPSSASSEGHEHLSTALRRQPPPPLPTYTPTSHHFLIACQYLYHLLHKKDTALHSYMWDDFVRFFSTTWWPLWVRSQLATAAAEDSQHDSTLEDDLEPPLTMYCRVVQSPLYTGRVLNPATLRTVIEADPGDSPALDVIRVWSRLGREGRPMARSRLWLD